MHARVPQVRKVLFCSGQVYYDAAKALESNGVTDVALVRVEQLAPFPFADVTTELSRYPNAEIGWLQEEHKNMVSVERVRESVSEREEYGRVRA